MDFAHKCLQMTLHASVVHIRTVPLNYNFISTCVDMRGNMQYFACKMPLMEIVISLRQDVAFPQDEMWHLHEA